MYMPHGAGGNHPGSTCAIASCEVKGPTAEALSCPTQTPSESGRKVGDKEDSSGRGGKLGTMKRDRMKSATTGHQWRRGSGRAAISEDTSRNMNASKWVDGGWWMVEDRKYKCPASKEGGWKMVADTEPISEADGCRRGISEHVGV